MKDLHSRKTLGIDNKAGRHSLIIYMLQVLIQQQQPRLAHAQADNHQSKLCFNSRWTSSCSISLLSRGLCNCSVVQTSKTGSQVHAALPLHVLTACTLHPMSLHPGICILMDSWSHIGYPRGLNKESNPSAQRTQTLNV